MVLFETWTLENFVAEEELQCTTPELRKIEKDMRAVIRQAEEIGDDFVVDPFYRVYWDIQGTDYGVPIIAEHAQDGQGGDTAYSYNHPLRQPEDVQKLRPRTWTVDRETTYARQAWLEDLFGEILPVRLHGTGGHIAALTSDLFRLIGNENLLTWPYDAPDALNTVMAYLRDDRLAYYRWLEDEGLVGVEQRQPLGGLGQPWVYHGPAGIGFWRGGTPARPVDLDGIPGDDDDFARACSPQFYLPYMAEVASCFGLVYYGCCEPVHDRWEPILRAIPQIRAVSISPWCDQKTWVMVGENVVFSRKPKPWLLSGDSPDWDALEKDVDETVAATRDGCLEIIFRDVYRINGDRSRLRQWVDLVRSRIG